MVKPTTTRTFGTIHFEDLEPHRFEDLIRELIYDYKSWQSIEATGRGGSDDGFDIRAFEKNYKVVSSENEDNEAIEELHPMEGNLWMIQVKREKQINPSKIKTILEDVNSNNPPYGYILAASANISKKSYDTFREILRKKGVMEFFIWGKAELEDMLHQPKNDRILFTFFGISLTNKKREKTTEIRSAINIKNKLIRILENKMQILIRNLNDESYPKKNEPIDSVADLPWNDYYVLEQNPLGLIIENKEYYSYIDINKKEWDYTDNCDLVPHNNYLGDEKSQKETQTTTAVEDFYDFLPRKVKGKLMVIGLLKYSDIILIDDKGDNLYNMPHIYVSYRNGKIPFSKIFKIIKINNEKIHIKDDFKQKSIFPKSFTKHKELKILTEKRIILNDESKKLFQSYQLETLFSDDDKYEYLNPRDIVLIENNNSEETYIQITFKTHEVLKNYNNALDYKQIQIIKSQIMREPDNNEKLYIYEFKRIYKWQLDELKK